MGGHFVEIHPSPRSEYYAAIAEKQWQKQGKPLTQQAQLNNSNELPELEPQKAAAIVPPNQQQTQWPQSAHQVDPAQPQALIHPQTDTRGKGQGQTVQGGRGGGRPGPTGVSRKIGGGVQVGDHTGFLRMRGLPFSASKENVVEFFKGHKIVPESVVLTYRSDGRATGESYASFETPEESKAAMALHRSTMGNRYIELFISNKEEHTRAFSRYAGR
eukprot:CAMPEP_0202475670 /NCGR_PEP_ID=MMETSP1360-20130828/93026_1 /ASSEMBLY_ACC=CAM_ASM_000848 /TAXON_ID=515479 /ORGANISM="Licmophora paradoxa, Strain CCMP2313" /LENGTH=215 /DNA_ID=CAMNT_0049102849 /DNA_START=648 /DNA_END=1295 /DNA_ORIENTATION=-